jgi:hypothetical protein
VFNSSLIFTFKKALLNKYVDRNSDYKSEHGKIPDEDLNEMKRIRILDQKCWNILKEFLIYIVFVLVLFVVTFSNISKSSFNYNILFQNTFVQPQTISEIGLNDVRFFKLNRP